MLKSKDKQVFLTTNTSFDFLNLTMKNTLGQDWIDFFSFVIVYCHKPLWHTTEAPFTDHKTDEQIEQYHKNQDEIKLKNLSCERMANLI
jgi:hypothetical protein